MPSPQSQSKRTAPLEALASKVEAARGVPARALNAAVGAGTGPNVSRSGSPVGHGTVGARTVGIPSLPIEATPITALEPLVPYVRGDQLVIFRADREAEIRGALRFADEMKLKPIILGGEDAWKVAGLLKEKNVPVILTGLFSLPSREDDPYDVLYESPAKLQQAGVRFCISTGDAGPEVRNLAQYAGMAAAFGLSKADAVKSVTLYPAQIMNVADRLGSIETGKMANLVVTDGDLLEIRSNIKYLFIDGRPVGLTSRHTELNEAFKNRK